MFGSWIEVYESFAAKKICIPEPVQLSTIERANFFCYKNFLIKVRVKSKPDVNFEDNFQ